jgi:hypothetical protein
VVKIELSKKRKTKFYENPFSSIGISILETDRYKGGDGSILTAVVTNGPKFAVQCV